MDDHSQQHCAPQMATAVDIADGHIEMKSLLSHNEPKGDHIGKSDPKKKGAETPRCRVLHRYRYIFLLMLPVLMVIFAVVFSLWIGERGHGHSDHRNVCSMDGASGQNTSTHSLTGKWRAIQEIEDEIMLDRISSEILEDDRAYSTGTAPHYYDGPFSLDQSCPFMRFRYATVAPPGSVHRLGFDRWSMQFQRVNTLSNLTRTTLSALREDHGFYAQNIHHQLISRVMTEHKVLTQPNLDILFYGNSHLKQVFLGLLCILHDIDTDIIVQHEPTVQYCHPEREHEPFDHRKTRCEGMDWRGIEIFNQQMETPLDNATMSISRNPIFVSAATIMFECSCSTESLCTISLLNGNPASRCTENRRRTLIDLHSMSLCSTKGINHIMISRTSWNAI